MTNEEKELNKKYADANNPNSKEETLIALSKDNSYIIRSAVAANSKTPRDVLIELSKDESENVRKKLATNSNLPIEALENLLIDSSDEVRINLSNNENCPVLILDVLKNDKNDTVKSNAKSTLLKIARTSTNEDNELDILITIGNRNIKLEIASNPNCSKGIFESLIKENDTYILERIINNESCPSEIIKELSNNDSYDIRCLIARNQKCTSEILDKLSKDESEYVRLAVIDNPKCKNPIDILHSMFNCKDEDIRNKVIESALKFASSKETSSEELSLLVELRSRDLYTAIIKNPNSTSELFEQILNNDNGESIKCLIARNNRISIPLLKELSKDDSEYVRIAVAENPLCTDKLNMYKSVYDYVISHRAETKEDRFIKSVSEYVRTIKNIYELEEISKFKYTKIKVAVLYNPICTSELFKSVFEHLSYTQKEEVMKLPHCPMDLSYDFLDDYSKKYYLHRTTKDLVFLSNGSDYEIRLEAIKKLLDIIKKSKNENNELYMISKSSCESIRMEVLNNQYCPTKVLTEYLNDKNRSIRKKAQKILNTRQQLSKFKEISEQDKKAELVKAKLKEDNRIKELKEKKKLFLESLKTANQLANDINDSILEDEYDLRSIERVSILEKELFKKVDDHKEFNDEYIEYIPFIDFFCIDTTNLKVSGFDFRLSNIIINPQTVYKKDLSNSKFCNRNISFKSFKGCNLCGTDLSDEKESYDIDQAIIDENTILPSRMKSKGI